MVLLNNLISDPWKIKNIIFDFGGVICDLDIKKTERKFQEFGPLRSPNTRNEKEQAAMWEDLVGSLETAAITPEEFRQAIREFYLSSPSDKAIDDAWNALLTGIPESRIRLLKDISSRYRIFLLSNSNRIHYQHFVEEFQQKSGYLNFDGLFEKAYFSFEVHIRKPSKEIFRLVLNNHGLVAGETLFIDDTLEHVLAAIHEGIIGYHLKDGADLASLFRSSL